MTKLYIVYTIYCDFLFYIIKSSFAKFLICLVLLPNISLSQIIPEDQRVDWSIANSSITQDPFKTASPVSPLGADAGEKVFNILEEYGADNKGVTDNSDILQFLLLSTPPNSVIYFPPGVYLFKQSVLVPSDKIIRGRSPNTTFLKFDLNGRRANLFNIAGSSEHNYLNVESKVRKGASELEVENTQTIRKSDYVEIEKENSSKMYTNEKWNTQWSQWAVGQIMRVTRVKGNKLEFDRKFTIDYDEKSKVRLYQIEPVTNVGFERFTIERVDGGMGINFSFVHAVNSWIKCIHSKNATQVHARFTASRDCSVRGSFFDNAQYHCGGGAGYGILLHDHTSECIVENNIFRKLRHSYIIKEGATRNVFSYNYSFDPFGSQGAISNNAGCDEKQRYSPTVDVSLHGHYPSMNLIEHNIVQHISSADYWGPSGPGNTFFRNRVESFRSIAIRDYSQDQNVIGNYVVEPIDIADNITSILLVGNNMEDDYENFRFVTQEQIPKSYYVKSKPEFYGTEPWPSIGPEYPEEYATIPAKERWTAGKIFDKKCCGDIPGLSSTISYYDDFIVFFDKENLFIEYPKTQLIDILISTVDGKTIYKGERISTNQAIPVHYFFRQGMYIVNIYNYDEQNKNVVKILKLD